MADISKISVSNMAGGSPITYNIKDRTADLRYGTCETDSDSASKYVSLPGFSLTTGATIHVKFINSNTANSPTLNVNGVGEKPLVLYGTTAVGQTPATSWNAGAILPLTYDGVRWIINNYNNTNSNDKVTQNPTSADSNYPILTAAPTATTSVTSTTSYNTGVAVRPANRDIALDVSTSDELYTVLYNLGWWSALNIY